MKTAISCDDHNELTATKTALQQGRKNQQQKKQQQSSDTKKIKSDRTKASGELVNKVRQLIDQEIDFISNKSFGRKTVQKKLEQPTALELNYAGSKDADDKKIPSYLSQMCSTPLLTPEQEVECFRRMNYLKFRFNQVRSQLNPDRPDGLLVEQAETYLQSAQQVREIIICANLRLVVSVTRKFVTSQLIFDELFSDGVLALMNAVEKFDFDRGYRFSTYAYYSISRSLYRHIKLSRKNQIQTDVLDQVLEDSSDDSAGWNQENWEYVNTEIGQMLQQLDRREQWIIRQRYSLDGNRKAPTYKVLAEKLGICNERVRQLEKRALNKLRGLSEENRLGDILDSIMA